MEARLQANCLKEARRRGLLAYKTVAVGIQGFPDAMLVASGGKIVFVEFKQPGGRLRPAQVRRIKELEEHCVITYVIDTYEKFTGVLDRLAHP
jgi:hypothetical protein